MDKRTGELALRILKDIKRREAEYRADVDEWYRAGDGRSPKWVRDPETGRSWNAGGHGWRYPACIHGTDLWTDYDNICGGCEDGHSPYQLALWEAKGKVAKYEERMQWLLSAPTSFKNTEMFRDLVSWVAEPLN